MGPKWDYITATLTGASWRIQGSSQSVVASPTTRALLEECGQDGWELVTVLPDKGTGTWIFKRPEDWAAT